MLATVSDLYMEFFLRRRDKLIWRTKEGKEIPIKELTDSHLNNIIKMIERKIREQEELYEELDDLAWLDLNDIC